MPKLIKSDSESNSIPKLELLFSRRANFPSKLSKKDAKTMKPTEISHLDSKANLIDVTPSVKDTKVNIFGINLLKLNLSIKESFARINNF